MSIYSTILLTPSEAIKLIAEHVCADANEPQLLEMSDNDLLERILFRLTDGNKHSPYHYNNYTVIDDKNESTLEKFKEKNYL